MNNIELKEKIVENIRDKYQRDSMMRRNKLLLEHIMLERLENFSESKKYFATRNQSLD